MEFEPSLIYHRLFRWLMLILLLMACPFVLFWLAEVKQITRSWDYHSMQVESGKLQNRMRLSDNVWLLRSRHAVSINDKTGAPIIPYFVHGIAYASEARDAVLVSVSSEPAESTAAIPTFQFAAVVTQLGQTYDPGPPILIYVDLATGAARSVYASPDQVLPVDKFFPPPSSPQHLADTVATQPSAQPTPAQPALSLAR